MVTLNILCYVLAQLFRVSLTNNEKKRLQRNKKSHIYSACLKHLLHKVAFTIRFYGIMFSKCVHTCFLYVFLSSS